MRVTHLCVDRRVGFGFGWVVGFGFVWVVGFGFGWVLGFGFLWVVGFGLSGLARLQLYTPDFRGHGRPASRARPRNLV